MANRVTGMYSGLDTESLIQDLMKAKRKKTEKTTKSQTKLEWKQEKWKDLNTKLNKLLSGTISSLRWSTSYQKKVATSSNPNAVSVITGEGAMSSVQSLSIKQLASSGYLTGSKVSSESGAELTKDSKLSELAFKDSAFSGSGSFDITVDGKSTTINVTADTTISSVVSQLNNAGVSANFDEKNQRLFIGAKTSGEKADFTITANDGAGNKALSALGINTAPSAAANAKYAATKAMGSSFVYGEDGSFDAEATIEAIQGDTSSAAYKELMATAKADYSARVNTVQSEYNALDAEIKKLEADLGNDILTDDDKAMINEQLEAKRADFEAKSAELDEMKANLDGGVYDTEALTKAVNDLKSKVDFATQMDNPDASMVNTGAIKLTGSDAVIELNGAEFTSATNSVSVNGLTFVCNAVAEDITITTQDDTNGIYDMVKSFIKEYNAIINEMDSLYNASTTKIEPLTDEERDAVSEKEAEKLEQQVKDSLFRRDDTLGLIFNGLKDIMQTGFEVNGKTMYLSNFGISTGGYFTSAEGERNAFHIDGDKDDLTTAGNEDKLKSMIATDSESVISFFTQLGKSLYSKMQDLSATSEDSSFGSFYDDKRMNKELDSIKQQIAKEEDALIAYEDKYYAKFAAMEVALSKMESKNSYLSGLFASK